MTVKSEVTKHNQHVLQEHAWPRKYYIFRLVKAKPGRYEKETRTKTVFENRKISTSVFYSFSRKTKTKTVKLKQQFENNVTLLIIIIIKI